MAGGGVCCCEFDRGGGGGGGEMRVCNVEDLILLLCKCRIPTKSNVHTRIIQSQ